MKLSSFRKASSDTPIPPRTPSPILRFVEPLTPTYPTAPYKDGPLFPASITSGLVQALQNYGWAVNNVPAGEETESEKEQDKARRASRSSRHANGNDSRTPGHGSPIDALADAASSLVPSPLFAPPSAHPLPPQVTPQPATRSASNSSRHTHTASDGQNYRHSQSYDRGYEGGYRIDGRPSKRARSEVAPSNQHTQNAFRPATSHIPQGEWSQIAEKPTPTGYHTYHEQTPHGSNAANNDEMDIAQVLLGLRNGSIDGNHSARKIFSTPQSQYANAGIPAWSESYPVQGPTPTGPQYQHRHSISGPYQSYHHSNPFVAAEPESARRVPDDNGVRLDNQGPSAAQTHTPPEESFDSLTNPSVGDNGTAVELKRGKGHQGWPKGKPRGPRNKTNTSRKSSRAGKTNDTTLAPSKDDGRDQLQSPQSLPAELSDGASSSQKQAENVIQSQQSKPQLVQPRAKVEFEKRRRSIPEFTRSIVAQPREHEPPARRASSLPPEVSIESRPLVPLDSGQPAPAVPAAPSLVEEVTICAGCNFSRGPSTGQKDQWIGCNGCQNWYHFACAGFKNAKEVSGVDKFFCRACRPKFGPTTFVRKSKRAHTAVDYAGLNEGVLRTSEDEYEHHYIQAIKDGTFKFLPETFPRMRPELATAENFEKSGGFKEPIVIPACWNPRPPLPGTAKPATPKLSDEDGQGDAFFQDVEYETVPDDGQDALDMVIPQGLTVRRVAELYGPDEKVEVIDVKSQEGEEKRWNMAKWADYYEEEGEKPVRNVISLEISHSKLGRLIRRPKVVRDLDLQDSVWPDEETARSIFPKVQFYCLMSVADCYTDFHIDFGGSSVYYHIIKGKKTFFFIPPKKQHLKKYEDWCLSQAQNWTFLADETKECYRVDLSEGDTMLIPSGWIHAVWTPENSLVIGGNFLTRLNFGMQIRIAEIEKNTKVARKFRYPHFQKVLWYTVLQYLQRDPVPQSVVQTFYEGKQFHRERPIYTEPNKFGHNSDPGPENYNARYYARSELEGLPDLISYIFRTVMISHGRVEGITMESRNAVTKSIPKGYGDPLETIKTFAMWAAWKRGNENIPQWAHPDAVLPEAGNSNGEKKLSSAALKKLERKAFIESFPPERQSARQQKKAQETDITDESPPPTTAPMLAQPVKHTSTPKTSVLGPKRIACDACRKRRIRCKHKDEVMSPLANTTTATPSKPGERRPSTQLMAIVIPSFEKKTGSGVQANGLKADGQLTTMVAASSIDIPHETPDSKRGRSKACLDCRKSKRRCIHDEYGNIDPIKAQEAPIPRGSQSAKKRRVSGGVEDGDSIKKPKKEPRTSFSLPSGLSLSDHDIIPSGQDQTDQEVDQPAPQVTLSSEISMPDAPPVEPISAIDPMLENYPSQIGTIEEEVDQIMVNGIDPIIEHPPQVQEVPPTDASDIALPSTERGPSLDAEPVTNETPHPAEASNEVPNGVEPSSPLTDLAASVSPQLSRKEIVSQPGLESPTLRHSSRPSRPVERYSSVTSSGYHSQPLKSGNTNVRRTTSRTPAPPGASKSAAVTPARQRRQSNASVDFLPNSVSKGDRSVSLKPRAMSHAGSTEEDEASMRLIRELMGEDRGLRRRGSR